MPTGLTGATSSPAGLAFLRVHAIVALPPKLWTLAVIFVLGGISVGANETLEDSLGAELVAESQRGMAFGTLAAVNGVGDFGSSIVVGFLWIFLGMGAAFGQSAVLFLRGAWMVYVMRTRTGSDIHAGRA